MATPRVATTPTVATRAEPLVLPSSPTATPHPDLTPPSILRHLSTKTVRMCRKMHGVGRGRGGVGEVS
jgi:hypothetical protein